MDVISLHARYTEETAGMVNAERIAMMKPTAVLVNTARGELVDHDALYEALAGGWPLAVPPRASALAD